MTLSGEDVLFVGLGKSVPQWYRCALPAYHLGARWIGLSDYPPRGLVATGNTMHTSLDVNAAKVFIVQQSRGYQWRHWIKQARKAGAKILYEVDDFIPGVEKLVSSSGTHVEVTDKVLSEFEMCIEECDGVIVSTEYIGDEWIADLNDRWWVCRNGIDTVRFNRRRAKREKPTVGWFGGGAHDEAVALWAPAVEQFCNENELSFLSIGQQYDCWSGIDALLRVPFVAIECVPDVLAGVDIGLAPWVDTPFYHGKSDLRALEGAAASISMLADYRGYGDTECWFTDPQGVYENLTSMLATYPDWADDTPPISEPAWKTVGPRARKWVERERDASVTVTDWEVPLGEMAEEY